MKKISLFSLTLILVACSAGKREFSRNQKMWQDANISHYRFELDIGCYCGFQAPMPLEVEVSNNVILSITDSDGKLITQTDPNYEWYSQYATIDRLFTDLKADLGGAVDEVTATYDPTYGFPDKINIDVIKEAVDDELSLRVSRFEALP